jgi:hypothetical protein
MGIPLSKPGCLLGTTLYIYIRVCYFNLDIILAVITQLLSSA